MPKHSQASEPPSPIKSPKPRKDPRRSLGTAGEEMAVNTLRAAGFDIVARNWRCSAGEIDIIAQERAFDFATGTPAVPWLVIVEVRTRRGDHYGTALQSIVARKQAKLRTVARTYIQSVGWQGPWRIDVVAIQMDSSGRLLAVQHIRHAVQDE